MGGVRFLIILVRCVFEWACVGSPWLLNFFKDRGVWELVEYSMTNN